MAQTFGLEEVPVGPRDMGLAVLTDLGLSIYKDDHFEYLKLPLSDGVADARQVVTRGGSSLVRSGLAVYAVDQGRVSGDERGYVHDILSADDWGLTFVARGEDGLEVVRQDDPAAGAQKFDGVNATHLARLPDGRVVTNDDKNIVAYGKGDTSAQVLFDATPTDPAKLDSTGVSSILAASDGTLWVSSGSSVFRYRDGKATEYSTFVDQNSVPGLQRDDLSCRRNDGPPDPRRRLQRGPHPVQGPAAPGRAVGVGRGPLQEGRH